MGDGDDLAAGVAKGVQAGVQERAQAIVREGCLMGQFEKLL